MSSFDIGSVHRSDVFNVEMLLRSDGTVTAKASSILPSY